MHSYWLIKVMCLLSLGMFWSTCVFCIPRDLDLPLCVLIISRQIMWLWLVHLVIFNRDISFIFKRVFVYQPRTLGLVVGSWAYDPKVKGLMPGAPFVQISHPFSFICSLQFIFFFYFFLTKYFIKYISSIIYYH